MKRPVSGSDLQSLSDHPGRGWVGTGDEPVELKESGLNQRDALLSVTDDMLLFRNLEGDSYASIAVDGHIEHHPVQSKAFADLLLAAFARRFKFNGRPASVSKNVVQDARQHLESRALVDGIVRVTPLRVGEHDGAIYVDVGDAQWRAVKISGDGRELVRAAPVAIVRSRRTAAMALPLAKGDFGPLRQLLAYVEDDDFILIIAWCLAALWPRGPYPILILGGEQGSGKTSLARLVQRIVDPVVGDLLQPPGDDRDLIAAAKNGRVLAFDNVSSLKPDLADSLCRLATGAEIGGRALYTNPDTATFAACRPIILNGIPHLVSRGDLADRSIVIKLGRLTSRTTERDFWRRVDEVLPQTRAALLDAMALALTHLEETAIPDVRMADFGQLIVAAEPALPWHPGDFLSAYEFNRRKILTVLIKGDLVATRLVTFAKKHHYSWSGLVSELYADLSQELSPEAKRLGEWPGNARWFSDRMARAAPALRAIGIDIQSKEEAKGTRVSIREIAPVAPPAPPDQRPNGASGANGASSQVSNSDRDEAVSSKNQPGGFSSFAKDHQDLDHDLELPDCLDISKHPRPPTDAHDTDNEQAPEDSPGWSGRL